MSLINHRNLLIPSINFNRVIRRRRHQRNIRRRRQRRRIPINNANTLIQIAQLPLQVSIKYIL
ncbi:hypothetical protein C1645_812163 [Glomus cerebriforme]|uniref:Uncharacterized protein n=1 Tax=Glomus cerebriforme TaxID=658196 RepID=A0A397TLJ8_9GLOM|nr:hypothetical protein C1645_812163 [Glomus cerebriforme]